MKIGDPKEMTLGSIVTAMVNVAMRTVSSEDGNRLAEELNRREIGWVDTKLTTLRGLIARLDKENEMLRAQIAHREMATERLAGHTILDKVKK